jgi:hypothetical protein
MLKIIRKSAFLLWLLSCFHLSQAQDVIEPKIKFGEFNLADIQMKSYDKDSTADAVVLYDYGQTTFDVRSGAIYQRFVYHKRVKIFKKSALDLGTVSMQLVKGGYEKDQFISDIKGYTYNLENGEVKKEKLTKESIFIEKPVGELQSVKITMPNVKEGSVFEYTYIIDTPFGVSWNPSTWEFQGTNPVMWSIYEISIPSYFTYRMLMSGYLGLASNKTEQVNIRLGSHETNGVLQRFVMKDAPAFRNEAYITSPSDYVSKIDFELASIMWPSVLNRNFSLDYPSLNHTMLENQLFGGQLKKTGFLEDVAKEIKNRYKDSTSRLKAACEYIQKNVKWNGGYNIYSNSLKKVLEAHKGDAGDINLLLVALLREIGFDANPVILSTRKHGRIHEQYALMKKFNYVVAHIERNGKDLLIDATDEYLKLGMLPVRCLNGMGWLVHPSNGRFVKIIPTEKEVEFNSAILKIDEEGELKGTISKSYSGYGALNEKRNFKDKGHEKYLDEAKQENANWVIEKADYFNTDDLEAPMRAQYEITLNDYITKAVNMLYLNPMLSERKKENLLKATERLYPIDFAYPIEETFMATYEFPKSYSIVELPKNISLTLPEGAGKFTYAIAANENKITLTSRIQFRKAVYYAEEYSFLQEFFDKIVAKHQEQIVLKKD